MEPNDLESAFRVLIESVAQAVWETNAEGVVVADSPTWRAYTGQTFEECRGSGWLDAIHPDDHEYAQRRWREAVASESDVNAVFRLRGPNGQWRWTNVRAAPFRDDEGRITKWVGMNIDITERMETERELGLQRERLAKIVETIPVLLVQWDPNLRRFTLNPHAEAVLGWTTDDANDGDFMEKVYPDPDYRETVSRYMQSLSPGWREWNCTSKDGHAVPIDWANVRLTDDAMIGIGVDLRERRQVEAELKRLNEELEHRVAAPTAQLKQQTERYQKLARRLARTEHRERKRLAEFLHDELQQYLVAIKMKLESATAHTENPQEVRSIIGDGLELTAQTIERSRHLTRQLRPPVLYEDGLIPALRWLAEEMMHLHGLKVEVYSDVGHIPLEEDLRALLFESVRELLFNVVKHAGISNAEVRVTDRKEMYRFIVSDQGAGYDTGLNRLRGSKSGGLGLLNIQERFQTIDGNLAIDSAPGRGTRVYLEVPKSNLAAVQAAGEPKTPPKESAGPGESRTRARSSNGVSLLVVDDHTIVREGIVNSLGKEPRIRVVGEASDGSEALVAIEQLCPDVVLMDLNMPRLNGIEATREIRRRWPHVRIVGLSVQDESGTAQSMIDAGAEAFLSKSDSAHQMAEAILNVAESDPRGDEPPQRG